MGSLELEITNARCLPRPRRGILDRMEDSGRMIDRECPKCGEALEFQEYDPDCGIEGGWVCANEVCDHSEPYEPYEPDEPDLDRTEERK
jgi:hypothetical protein